MHMHQKLSVRQLEVTQILVKFSFRFKFELYRKTPETNHPGRAFIFLLEILGVIFAAAFNFCNPPPHPHNISLKIYSIFELDRGYRKRISLFHLTQKNDSVQNFTYKLRFPYSPHNQNRKTDWTDWKTKLKTVVFYR